ncbi:class I mannose-6-phosphate isomerase [Paenibacillus sp. J5C_2022]|uniref:class I mannose-6-phosphate isomerase n=1 Tax=Paenibacillus sp. J5C2022 TaxID=2977129 RepID=UPI0021CDFE96|nr:class I mannose-6-phosphate isomerase [Paenibacillus sp. J5C2022]MCU6713026.1 class I mannose-6-phosphate isomerase [Paenibacillus sp. J5C2022]
MFNKYPVNPVRRETFTAAPLAQGYDAVCRKMLDYIHGQSDSPACIVIDGTHGAEFQSLVRQAVALMEREGRKVNVQSTAGFLLSGEQLREQFAGNITDNRAFGYVVEGAIADYFRVNARAEAAKRMDEGDAAEVQLLFGPGAHWLAGGREALVLYADVSREYQQVEHKKQLLNFGMTWNKDAVEKYKICYFVEWPILENYRKALWPSMHYYIDMNQPSHPVIVSGEHLQRMIKDIALSPLRVKPFFAPGVWGGQYLKELADLPKEWVNCAWGFEPIAPENSILIGCGEDRIEVPFLIVMALEYEAIMGARAVSLFGDYFPVRFDFLDTMDGDNLSCQVHPKQEYVRETFNEFMTQQESYYIMDLKNDAKVYLGMTEGTTKEQFLEAVEGAQESGVPMAFTNYVNEWNAKKGDLFLIPPGTVHCSGKDNLVLEISSTTWWFTFKIYDYLRKDLDGKPRPINVDHGFRNIDFDKTTEWVKDNLIPEPRLVERQGDNEEYGLGERDDLLFYVNRVHLQTVWHANTNGEFVMYNLVEGERVRIVSCKDESVFVELDYAESYIIPSVFGAYKIVNMTDAPCKLVKAGVSSAWDVSLLDG